VDTADGHILGFEFTACEFGCMDSDLGPHTKNAVATRPVEVVGEAVG
jgi:hypothetical protein